MFPRPWLTTFATFVIMLAACRVACANVISPSLWFWPGFISVGLAYAFPASLLASFVERPFLTAAGLEHRALVLSLRANFLSTIVGILLVPVTYHALFTLGPLWCLVAFGLSCAIEILYLDRFSPRFAWRWAIGGNAISSVLLIFIPPIAFVLKYRYYALARALEPYETRLIGWSLAVSVAVFLLSFAWPVRKQQAQGSASVDRQQPERQAAEAGERVSPPAAIAGTSAQAGEDEPSLPALPR